MIVIVIGFFLAIFQVEVSDAPILIKEKVTRAKSDMMIPLDFGKMPSYTAKKITNLVKKNLKYRRKL